MKTIVLLSGGIDSAVVLAHCIAAGDQCLALAFDYNQPHRIELNYARKLAEHYRTPFRILNLPAMPLADDVVFAARNLIMASHAVGYAQKFGYDCIAVGCNESDWLRFPDCRPAFWKALHTCAAAYDIEVHTPLLYMWKQPIVQYAQKLGVPIEQTWSCYSPQLTINGVDQYQPCGSCLACKTREDALKCLTPAS